MQSVHATTMSSRINIIIYSGYRDLWGTREFLPCMMA